MKLTQLLEEILLLEYSKGLINGLIKRYLDYDSGLDVEEIKNYIKRFAELKDSPQIREKDIRKYDYASLVRAVDGYKTTRIKAGTLKAQPIDANLIYNDKGVRVYVGKTKRACIKYGHGFNFCISSRGEMNMYEDYRFLQKGTPFFVFNDNPEYNNPEDEQNYSSRIIVIFVYHDHMGRVKKYSVTDALNEFEQFFESLDSIVNHYPWVGEFTDLIVKYDIVPEEHKDYASFIMETLNRRLQTMLRHCAQKENENVQKSRCDSFYNHNVTLERFVKDPIYCISLDMNKMMKTFDTLYINEQVNQREVGIVRSILRDKLFCMYTHDIDESVKKDFIFRQSKMLDYETKVLTMNKRSDELANFVNTVVAALENNLLIENITADIRECVRNNSHVLQDLEYHMKQIGRG